MRNAVLVPLHLDAFVGQNLTFSHQISVQLKTSEHFRAHFFVFRAQFLTKRRNFRPDPFLSCAERWQDSRAVRDSRGPCSEKGPFPARSSRGVFPNGYLRGFSDAWRAYPAKASPFSDAWSAKLAPDCRPGTHRGGILPRQDPRERIAREYCHYQSGQECIRAQSCRRRTLGGRTAREYCHYQSPGNAFRAYPAIAGRLGTHSVDILPSPDIRECTASAYRHCQSPVTQRSPRGGVGSVPWLCCGLRRATLSVRGSGHSAFSGLNCWERFRVCAVSVGNHEPASRSAKLCRIMC